MVAFTDKFMKLFGNDVYDWYIDNFKILTSKYYYIRPNTNEDLKHFIKRQIVKERGVDVSSMELFQKSKEFTGDFDEVVVDILRFVKQHLTYAVDNVKWKTPEYWQDASETYELKTGDCEDGAILILTLARLCSVPAKRIFLRCGDVKVGTGKGGHAYVVYRANDGEEYILDWCYDYDGSSIGYRKASYKLSNYLNKWFDVNDEYCLGDKL